MSETIEVAHIVPASAERIFNAWLSSDEHGKMTGVGATYEPDGRFTTWDGYIAGKTLEAIPHRKFVQAWRTTEFPEGAPDSRVEVTLTGVDGGTQVKILHTEIPEGQGKGYEEGWTEYYFTPMTKYFSSAGSKLVDATEAIEGVAEDMVEQMDQAVEAVEETAKKAASAVKKLVAKARTKLKAGTKKLKAGTKKLKAQTKKVTAAVKKRTQRKPAPKKVVAKKKAVLKKAAPKKAAPKKKKPTKRK